MRPLNFEEKIQLIPQAITQYINNTATNQAQLARVSGVGEAYISCILQGKTAIGKTVIKDKYYTDLAKAVGYVLEQKVWGHYNTMNYMQMITSINKVRKNKGRLVIDGDTGAGKSYSCGRYALLKPTNTFVVTASAIENSKEFAINIAEVVGVETHGTTGRIIKRVVKKLTKHIEDALLIVDEAEHIAKKQGYINVIKSLSDALEDKVAFVLVGMGITTILQKGYERRKQNFRQTARRFGNKEICQEAINDDIHSICIELGLKKSVANWLVARIHNFGDLKHLLTTALEEAKKTGQEVDTHLLNSLYI